jgi:hypothetical protein
MTSRRPGLRREVVGVAGPCWRPSAQRRLALLGPAGAGRPWAPALLAAPEIARRQSPPPRSTTSPRFVERTLKCARAGERERQARVAVARARVREPVRAIAPRRATLSAYRDRWTRSPSRAHFSVLLPAKRGASTRGAGGGSCFAISGAARSAGAQGRPAPAGPRSASRRCALGRQHGPATPTTSRRSPGRRAPQRSRAKAAGRSRPRTHERNRNPHPPRDARSPSASRSPRASPSGGAPGAAGPGAKGPTGPSVNRGRLLCG